ncbi:MAG TPA: hypothetical protein VLG76_07495 [Rhabdochlamydiaceae bacterium]|nr:hypothetical protein [Rhabdochlamydiaceae bacterium]
MPMTVQGVSITSPEELFRQCQIGEAGKVALALKERRYSYNEIPQKEKKLGSFDATSCVGVVYRTADHSVYVQHHDGRPLESLLTIFDRKERTMPLKVTLIGGSRPALSHNYECLEKHTKENLEKLVKFWKDYQFNINLQGWAIGEGNDYATLCSDFMVDEEKIYLIKQGEIGYLNLEMKGELVPEASRRLATMILDYSRFSFVYNDSNRALELPGIKNINQLKQIAESMIEFDDDTILVNYSTTPDLEPPYFPQMMRNMASYVLAQKGDVPSLKVPLSKNQPVFAIQGEVVKKVFKN